jgi:hypothetical protein
MLLPFQAIIVTGTRELFYIPAFLCWLAAFGWHPFLLFIISPIVLGSWRQIKTWPTDPYFFAQ